MKPTVSQILVVGDGNGFEISWTRNSSRVHPVDSYRVELTFPAQGDTPQFTEPTVVNSTTTFLSVLYKQNEGDYSTANITVVVCAINDVGEACSEKVYHKGVERGGKGPREEDGGGVSGGGIAAIVIILLLFLCVGIFLLVLLFILWRYYFWRSYYPPIRGTTTVLPIMVNFK